MKIVICGDYNLVFGELTAKKMKAKLTYVRSNIDIFYFAIGMINMQTNLKKNESRLPFHKL